MAFLDLEGGPDRFGRGVPAKHRDFVTPPRIRDLRFKLKREQDYERVIEVFEAHNIRYFFTPVGMIRKIPPTRFRSSLEEGLRITGDRGSQDDRQRLGHNGSLPGYGAWSSTLFGRKETALDHEAMGQHDLVSIIEVMGRNAGWIAAGTTLAKGGKPA